MTWPETPTVPVEEVVEPAAPELVDGALQPAGTVISTAPLVSPPVAAVYVNVNVRPVWPASTELGETLSAPEPSAESLTVTDGDDPIALRVPPLVDFSRVEKALATRVCEAVAPGPPLEVSP